MVTMNATELYRIESFFIYICVHVHDYIYHKVLPTNAVFNLMFVVSSNVKTFIDDLKDTYNSPSRW